MSTSLSYLIGPMAIFIAVIVFTPLLEKEDAENLWYVSSFLAIACLL